MSHGHGFTTTGRRDNNEDSFVVSSECGLYVVADGMGGHDGGEVASRIVVDTLESFFKRGGVQPPSATLSDDAEIAAQQLTLALRMCQCEVRRRALGPLRSMGSTAVAALVRGTRVIIAHVGDSRAYRVRDGEITQLTQDHSLYAEMIAAGASALVQKLGDRLSSVITRSVGANGDVQPDVRVEEFIPGDRLILCSDGVTQTLSDNAIASLSRTGGCEQVSRLLVDSAYQAGSSDNITAVVIDLDS